MDWIGLYIDKLNHLRIMQRARIVHFIGCCTATDYFKNQLFWLINWEKCEHFACFFI